jgi:cell division protein FtsW (lipid II flippase)
LLTAISLDLKTMTSITQSIHLSQYPDRIQGRLLVLAGIFLGLYALALTLAPAARARSWEAGFRWNHWLGYLVWVLLVLLTNQQSRHYLPKRDPYLIPVALLLCGWGLMTIWRLFPGFGGRQTIWLVIAMVVFILGLRLPIRLEFLRRYKYVWLTGGLILTAFTLLFGTNPASDSGPRLWLGCCGVYFQPSEPLKLLLIIYLSAYLADKQPWVKVSSPRSMDGKNNMGFKDAIQRGVGSYPVAILAPILLMTGLALLLLLVQRDLGTVTIFLFLFAVIVYLATESKSVLIVCVLILLIAGIGSYFLFDVVRLRIDAWLNPWLDPSGRSYQIVQSLLALANGGVGGRGPGMGSPTLVPISHSDFIFSAIVEENGLIGATVLIGLLMVLTASGFRVALRAPDNFRRYLAAGLTAYLVGQSLLIIGGNIRLLPLTGVTLPFVSYGGSSLLAAYLSLLILILISQSANANPTPATKYILYERFGFFLLFSLMVAAIVIGWWAFVRGPALLERTDNARRAIADRYVRRGDILDRHNIPLVTTEGSTGDFSRFYQFPELGSVVGYSHPVYGQTGLEANFDLYLRGLRGNSDLLIWWNHIIYGQPPAGLDVRLSIDLSLQQKASELMSDYIGALVLLNSENGEILVSVSNPTYDPNQLEEVWSELINDTDTPLINRVHQGQYRPGTALGPFILASLTSKGRIPQLQEEFESNINDQDIGCATTPANSSLTALIAAGCIQPLITLSQELGGDDILMLMDDLGFFTIPSLDQTNGERTVTPIIGSPEDLVTSQSDLRVSPLQLSLAAATLSSGGVRPVPQLMTALNLPVKGWTVSPPVGESTRVFSRSNSVGIANSLAENHLPIWQSISSTPNGQDQEITWYMAGTLPSWSGPPITLVILLEENDPIAATAIGQAVMETILQVE